MNKREQIMATAEQYGWDADWRGENTDIVFTKPVPMIEQDDKNRVVITAYGPIKAFYGPDRRQHALPASAVVDHLVTIGQRTHR
jgi:hypothetical protein